MPSFPSGSIRLLTLDATNTVIGIPKSVGGAYADFARRFGVHCDADALTTAFMKNFKLLSVQKPCYGFGKDGSFAWWSEIIRNCFEDVNVTTKFENFDDFSKQLFNHFCTTEPWQLIDAEASEHLTRIRSKGVHIGVISNFDSRLRSVLEQFKLVGLIDLLLLSGEIGIEKPDPRIFQLAANRFQLDSTAQMVHIGDNVKKDYDGARAAGANALLFVGSMSTSDAPRGGVQSEDIIHSLADLTKFI
ncbi:unnamed protein product [Anisakis simplex]|uniref:Haloacid dehalogenase-like hydrolase domain-containing protein 3 n=1 Tax=Anisakis simplex TaxID=6269 RepID=A0A0M3K040_ANISI|nr:unnamed protein product [Anisakis simplex]